MGYYIILHFLPFAAGVLDRFCLKYDETFGERFDEHELVPTPLPLHVVPFSAVGDPM